MGKSAVQGIYVIEFASLGSVYVGQSVNIEKRIRTHLNCLLSETHYNGHLQSAFNNDGKRLQWRVLEIVDKRIDLASRERFWIEHYKEECFVCNIADPIPNMRGPNVTQKHKESLRAARANVGKYWSEKHRLSLLAVHEIMSPDGELYKTTNGVMEFCKEHNLNYTRVMDVLTGRFRQHHGWILPETARTAKVRYSLRSPDGNIHIIRDLFHEFADFCRSHNLDQANVNRLRSGKIKSYKGWTWHEIDSD